MKKRNEFIGKKFRKALKIGAVAGIVIFVAGVLISCDGLVGGNDNNNTNTDDTNNGGDTTTPTVTASISNLVASASANTVSVNFDGENAGSDISYVIKLYNSSGSVLNTQNLPATTSTYSHSFTDQAASTEFRVGVSATDASGNVITSEVQSATVSTPSTYDVNGIDSFTETHDDVSATLKWKTLSSDTNYFKVYYKEASATDFNYPRTILQTAVGADGYYTLEITNLTGDKQYNFKIEAYDVSGELIESETKDITTDTTYAYPKALTGKFIISKQKITTSSIELAWTPVNTDINGKAYPTDNLPAYEIRNGSTVIATTAKGATSFNLTKDLLPTLSSSYQSPKGINIYAVWQKNSSSTKQYSSAKGLSVLIKSSSSKEKYYYASDILASNLQNMLLLGYFDSDPNKATYQTMLTAMQNLWQNIYDNATTDAEAEAIVAAGLSNGHTFDADAQTILQLDIDKNYLMKGLSSNGGWFFINFNYDVVDNFMKTETDSSDQYTAMLLMKAKANGEYLADADEDIIYNELAKDLGFDQKDLDYNADMFASKLGQLEYLLAERELRNGKAS